MIKNRPREMKKQIAPGEPPERFVLLAIENPRNLPLNTASRSIHDGRRTRAIDSSEFATPFQATIGRRNPRPKIVILDGTCCVGRAD